MLAFTSHTLTTSWSFCNLLVWAVFCMINLRKHSFEFEDYKKPIMPFLLLTISLLPFQNIFCQGHTISSSKPRPSDQMPLGTTSTVKTQSLFDLQFVVLKVPVCWIKPTSITSMSSQDPCATERRCTTSLAGMWIIPVIIPDSTHLLVSYPHNSYLKRFGKFDFMM